MLSGIVFDLDDTLADSSGVHRRVWPDVLATVARHVPGIDGAAFLGRYDGVMEGYYDRLLRGELDFRGFRRQRLAAALEPWCEVGDELFEAYLAVKERVVADLRPRPDALPTLRALRAAGVRVAVLTNGPSDLQRRKLEVTGIAAEVDAVAISGEIGARKPEGAAFAAALELIGCRPGAAAMVGDSLANDVHGALAHGFARVVWFAGSAGRTNGRAAAVPAAAASARVPALPQGVLQAGRLADVPLLLGLG